MAHSREEVQATMERYIAVRDAIDAGAGNWSDLAQFFTDDAVFIDPAWGRVEGIDEMKATVFGDAMVGLEAWKFPTEFFVIDGDNVVVKWWQVMPGHARRRQPLRAVGILDARLRGRREVLLRGRPAEHGARLRRHEGEQVQARPNLGIPPKNVNRDFSRPDRRALASDMDDDDPRDGRLRRDPPAPGRLRRLRDPACVGRAPRPVRARRRGRGRHGHQPAAAVRGWRRHRRLHLRRCRALRVLRMVILNARGGSLPTAIPTRRAPAASPASCARNAQRPLEHCVRRVPRRLPPRPRRYLAIRAPSLSIARAHRAGDAGVPVPDSSGVRLTDDRSATS